MSSEPIQITEIPTLPTRADDAHKGEVGRILVVGGRMNDLGMIGAPALAANAAMRAGAGLVQILTPAAAQPVVAPLAPCGTTRCFSPDSLPLSALAVEFGADVVALGPGLDPCVTAEMILELLNDYSGSIVLDADGLNTLADAGCWEASWPDQVVLTPHPGELKRLMRGFKVDTDLEDRRRSTTDLALHTGAAVVLKGNGTVVSDGERIYVNQTGNSGLATGGSGDVLTGVIAGLLGQQMSRIDAAVLGVYLHGLAGDIGAEEMGKLSLMAWDLLDFIPEAILELEPEESE
ncbi:MAG: NAD(P)H-hydrate dehydratase [Phycisphaerae bacterium]|nr:NAD(P)H-hydrate dehydratase [Phycisphaerae bacterium]